MSEHNKPGLCDRHAALDRITALPTAGGLKGAPKLSSMDIVFPRISELLINQAIYCRSSKNLTIVVRVQAYGHVLRPRTRSSAPCLGKFLLFRSIMVNCQAETPPYLNIVLPYYFCHCVLISVCAI